MTDFLTIWRLELRRQRLNLGITFLMIAVLAFLAFGGIFPHAWKDNLAGLFMLTVPLGGLLLSLDVFTRDFQQGTSPFFFSLPVRPWKVYLAKYLFSAFLFLFILVTSIVLTAFFTSLATLPWIVGWIDRLFDARAIAVVHAMTAFAVILLYFHASIILWCIAFRGMVGIAASFFLIPLVTEIFYPSFVWFSRDYPVKFFECVPQILVYVLILVFIGGIFWWRGIGMGRPMWILALKSLGILFTASVLSFVIFYGILVTEYMVTLSRFEKTPGIEIPMGKISVIRSIWKGKAPKSADDVLNADLKTTVEIPVADYGEYADRLQRFFLDSTDFITREIRLKHYDRALRLLDAYESIPESVIPEATYDVCLYPIEEFDENGQCKRKKQELFCASADGFVPGEFYKDKYNLKRKSGDEKKDQPYLILPFEKDTIPFLNKMIERMEKQPVLKERPIRVLPLGKEIILNFPWRLEERHESCQGLRMFLPGIETHGSARFLETLCFAFRMLPESNYPSQCLSGERLRLATRLMKSWIWSAEKRNEIVRKALRGEIFDCLPWYQNTRSYYEDFRLQNDFYSDVSKKYLWLPRLKLRKYALEHGTLPEKLSDALSKNEITHKVGDRVFRLEYSINPNYKKEYPRGSVFSRDYKGTRRHPFLYLVERKLLYHIFISRCELDEPEEKLPEKGVLK